MPNEASIIVKKVDRSELDKLAQAGRQAGDDVARGLKEGFREGEEASGRFRKQAGEDLDKTAKKAKDSGGEAGGGFGEKFAEGINTAKGGPDAIVGGALEKVGAGGGALAAGAAVASLLIAGFQAAMERQELGAELAGQLGGTVDDAGRYGNLAGRVYADNFGGSLEDAAGGIKAVVQNRLVDPHAIDSQIARMSELAITAGKVSEEEANQVARAVRQLLVNDLVRSAEEGFDLVTRAAQRGLNVNQDLVDTIVEYGTKFRDLGITGQQALGLISQAMDAGARNTDVAADALKEFAIRAEDGSVATARGFRTIGLDAESMATAIAQGGSTAHEALGKTLDGLRAIHDPVLRDQAAVDLFGTKAEDLGDALYAMDLDTAAKQFGDLAHATDDASTAMTTNAQKTSQAWRQFKDGVSDVVDTVGAKLYDLGGDLALVLGTAQKIAGTPVPAQDSQWMVDYKQRVDDAAHAWERQGGSIKYVSDTLEDVINREQRLAGAFADAEGSEIAFQKALDDAAESAKEHGKTLNTNTEAGRANKQSLLEVAQATNEHAAAMEQNGSTALEIQAFVAGAREQFLQLADKMGLGAGQANALADKLRLIPGDYQAHVSTPGLAAADSAVRTIHGHLVDLTNRRWIASVAVTGAGSLGGGRYFAGYAHGGPVGRAAEGGPRGVPVIKDEMGPELAVLPDGSTIVPAGMSRALLSGGGFGGAQHITVELVADRGGGSLVQAAATFVRHAVQEGALRLRVAADGRVTA